MKTNTGFLIGVMVIVFTANLAFFQIGRERGRSEGELEGIKRIIPESVIENDGICGIVCEVENKEVNCYGECEYYPNPVS